MISFRTGFINPQLEQGPIASSYFKSIQAELGFAPSGIFPSKHYAILDYFYNLSIGTFDPPVNGNANSAGIVGSGELAGIGYLVGYPWPSVYSADITGNNFQFINSASFPGVNPNIGFSSAVSGITYGVFTSATPSQAGTYVSVYLYQEILKFIAYIKWNGLTIPSIDYLISGVLSYFGYPIANGYTIKYGANNDIYVNFNLTYDNIGTGYLYLLQLVFNRVCTSPQVLLSIS